MYILLILARILHTMIYFHGDLGVGLWMLPAQIISFIIELAAALPLIFLMKSGKSVIDVLGRRAWAARLIRAGYVLFFLFIACGSISRFAAFMDSEFPRVASPIVVTFVIAFAAAYCSRLGIEALARAGTVVFAAFIILFLSMSLVSEGEFDALNLTVPDRGDLDSMWRMVYEDLCSSWWIPMLAVLAPYARGGAGKTVAAFLITKLSILAVLLILVLGVLGDFVRVIGYPILALGAYARTDFIRHFDAVNMFVWSLNCIVVISCYIFIALSESIAMSKSKKQNKIGIWRELLAGAAAATGAWAMYVFKLDAAAGAVNVVKLSGVIVLGIILPALAFAVMKRRDDACVRRADILSQ